MKISDAFPSKYLKASDVEAEPTFTISHVDMEVVGQDDETAKPVIYFKETKKGLACNKTNANTIAQLYGDDTEQWGGKRITLFATEVDFQGKQTLAIRVRMRKPDAAAPQAPTDAAKRVAWAAWRSRNPDIADDADALASRLQAIVNDIYPGITLGKLTPKQWSELERSGFNHPVTPAGTGINEADIPF